MKSTAYILIASGILLASCGGEQTGDHGSDQTSAPEKEAHSHYGGETAEVDSLEYFQEKHLKNVRQLTYGGNNAEAYWSFDNSKLVFQAAAERLGTQCDQIFIMDLERTNREDMPQMVSTGGGRTTCSFFLPGDTTFLYASTHLLHDSCPPEPERSREKYVWPVYSEFDIFVANTEGEIIQQLTDHPGYDAEATVSPDGTKIVFTSTRSGDLELWTMNIDGSDKKQITNEIGYDGGAFFSPDSKQIVWRASRPTAPEDVTKYLELLAADEVEPSDMELFIANVDGSNARQLTNLGNANWSPYFHPSGEKVLFCSNHKSDRGLPFNLYLINTDGTGLEQVTFDYQFDSFPMFSYDGKYLVWGSNRNNGRTRDTNLFMAEWVD